MFKFTLAQCREEAFLTKLVNKFKEQELPRFEKLQAYYRVENKIRFRTMESDKPNNKLAHGFARYITNMATSYFIGRPIVYRTEDVAYQEAFDAVLKANYIDKLNFETSKEGSKKGISFMLMFVNEEGKLKIKKCSAGEIIPVYSTKLGEFLECAVRIYSEYDIDGTLIREHADLYDSAEIHHYSRTNTAAVFAYESSESHMLDDIPVIVVWNNEDCMGDYEPIIDQIDAYDASQSDTANDMDYFSDAYLCLVGASDITDNALSDGGDDKAAETLRKNKILFLDEHGQAQWLTKNVNDAAVENYKSRLYKDMFFLSQVPALSDESFASNLSGVAIRYKLIGLEELAIMKQNGFQAAQTKLIKLITSYLNLKMNKTFDPSGMDIKFERNFIANTAELIDNAGNLEGMVSRRTQLEQLPNEIVPNVEDEIKRMEAESMEMDAQIED